MSNIECCCGVTIHVHKSSNAWVKHLRRNPGHYEIRRYTFPIRKESDREVLA